MGQRNHNCDCFHDLHAWSNGKNEMCVCCVLCFDSSIFMFGQFNCACAAQWEGGSAMCTAASTTSNDDDQQLAEDAPTIAKKLPCDALKEQSLKDTRRRQR